MEKPSSKEDLIPPFEKIGEAGWDRGVRDLLQRYEVPLPTPITEGELAACEKKLGSPLPPSLHLLLKTFGPLDLDEIRFFGTDEISSVEGIWFAHALSDEDRKRLPQMIGIGEYVGDEVIVVEPDTGRCCQCVHDPPGFMNWLNCVDDLLRIALIVLCNGYYGWDDERLSDMASELCVELFGLEF